MAAIKMYIDKFKKEVFIDDNHPDAIAQVERNRSQGTGVSSPPRDNVLRTDGPTLAEFVQAGYKAEHYPPKGYAARGDSKAPDEIVVVGTISGHTAEELGEMSKDELTALAAEFELKVTRTDATEGTPRKSDYIAALSAPTE